MFKITLNGKPFRPETLEDAVIQAVADQLRDKLGSIRDPDTGEFPTIAITGAALSELQAQVEGSPALLALVRRRLAGGETDPQAGEDSPVMDNTAKPAPQAFLSYAFEDTEIAERVAKALVANGIDTWWAGWCIKAGDSIRQRIDEGLEGCTHFIVLLTPVSVGKPWVNQEMDAGLVRKLNSGTRFIALRCGLAAGDLPPLLQGMHSPSIDPATCDVQELINDIHEITKKPPLGPVPEPISRAASLKTGYSPAATAVAEYFVRASAHGLPLQPMERVESLKEKLGLPEDDIVDAVHELKGLVTHHRHGGHVSPNSELFARLDSFWKDWDPKQDALEVAARMLNDDAFPTEPAAIAAIFGWEPRRLNPALAYLANRELARSFGALASGPWLLAHVSKTDETRRFVKSRS